MPSTDTGCYPWSLRSSSFPATQTVRVWEYGIPVQIKYIADPSMQSMPSVAVSPDCAQAAPSLCVLPLHPEVSRRQCDQMMFVV